MADAASSDFIRALSQVDNAEVEVAARNLVEELSKISGRDFTKAMQDLSYKASDERCKPLAEGVIVPALLDYLENPGTAGVKMTIHLIGCLGVIASAPHLGDLARRIAPALTAFQGKTTVPDISDFIANHVRTINEAHGFTRNPTALPAAPAAPTPA